MCRGDLLFGTRVGSRDAAIFIKCCFVNGSGVVSGQISKFFVSHTEEAMAGHVGVSGVYKKSGKEIAKGGKWWDQVEVEAESLSVSFPGAFKTYSNLWAGRTC
jgi:hypothetical protein